MRKPILLLYFTVFLTYSQVFSQNGPTTTEENTITGFFPGISFSQFVRQIENKTSYRFFYDQKALSQTKVNISASKNSLSSILEAVLRETSFTYHISKDHRVYIFPKGRVKKFHSKLSDAFWDDEEIRADSLHHHDNKSYTAHQFASNKLWVIGSEATDPDQKTAILNGTIRGIENGLPINGAIVYEKESNIQSPTNENGHYSITLPRGRHRLYIRYQGDYEEQRQINLLGDGRLDIKIEESIVSLDEFVVNSGLITNLSRPKMGIEEMSISTMKKLPAVLGEVDVLRSILTLPGVSSVGEASVGFHVRGGSADQNLVLYSNSTVYNPSHLFGLFSAFNADMVEGITLHKAGIPVQYGGRLSSVLEINPKFGNSESLKGTGGIGLMTSRLMLEGPVGSKTTFAVGSRITYNNWLLNMVGDDAGFRGGKSNFHDLNLNAEHKVNSKSKLRLTSYYSKDAFSFDQDTLYHYDNLNLNLEWEHFYNERLESEVSLAYDQYRFGMEGRSYPESAFNFDFNIKQLSFKTHFNYKLNENHSLNFGLSGTGYELEPGNLEPHGPYSILAPERVNTENALEKAIFIGDEYRVNDELSLDLGVRYVHYNYLGPNTVNIYAEDAPKFENTLINTKEYGEWENIQSYHGPEFRFSARYHLGQSSSLKLAYNTGRQFINLLTNTSAIAPTDTWKLSDPHLPPQWGEQISLGLYKNLFDNKVEFSAEAYRRNMQNLIDFRSGATLILNNSIEQDVLHTEGRSYGVELLLKKETGRTKGWVSYTYSRSLLRTSPDELAEKINRGEWYPSNFDQPHDLKLVANYEINKRVTPAINVAYSTGRPITLPIARFTYGGSERVHFSDRNAYRIQDYFRIDASLNLEGNHRTNKILHSSWTIGIYNLLGRSNPFSVYYAPVSNRMQGYQLSIFARPIPFVTYNFKF